MAPSKREGSHGDDRDILSPALKSPLSSKSSGTKLIKSKRSDKTPPPTPNHMSPLQEKPPEEIPRASSPPLLLSAGGGQNALHDNPRQPGRYTIADIINLTRSGAVTLPYERQLTPEQSTVPGFRVDYSSFIDEMKSTHGSKSKDQSPPKPVRSFSNRASAIFGSRTSGSRRERGLPRSISEIHASVDSGSTHTSGASRPDSEDLAPASQSFDSTRSAHSPGVERLMAQLHAEAAALGPVKTKTNVKDQDTVTREAHFATRNTVQRSPTSPGSPHTRFADRTDREARVAALCTLGYNIADTMISEDPGTEENIHPAYRTARNLNEHDRSTIPRSTETPADPATEQFNYPIHPNAQRFGDNGPFIIPRVTDVPEIEMANARRMVERDPPVAATVFKWDNDELVDMMGENHALAKKRRLRLAKNVEKKRAEEKKRDPSGWTSETPATTTFYKFMQLKDLGPKLFTYMMEFMLVTPGEDVVPYHYVEGKVLKDVNGGPGEVREKPNTNLLIALASSIGTKGRLILDDAQNVLFRKNRFSFRNPRDLIMFMNAIGSNNMMRMQDGRNLVVNRTFFSKKHQFTFEMKWLARWVYEMRNQMLGGMVITPDWDIAQQDPDYECPPIERELKIVVQALKEANEMEDLLGSSSTRAPLRIMSLDLGGAFSRVIDALGTINLEGAGESWAAEVTNDGDDTKSDQGQSQADCGDDNNENDESDTGDKSDEDEGRAGKSDLDYDEDKLSGRLGDWYLDHTTSGTLWDGTFMEDDDESVDSGWYSPSLISENVEAPPSSKDNVTGDGDDEDENVLDDGDYTWSDTGIDHRLSEVMAKHQ